MNEWFSGPAGQIALVAVVEAGALAWLYRSRQRGALAAVIAVPIIGAIVVTIDLVHASPREKVARALDEVRRAALAGDPATILSHVDPMYDYQGVTYHVLAAWLPVRLSRLRLTSLRITQKQFAAVAPTRITVEVAVRASGRSIYGPGFATPSRWRLTFVPLEDRWVMAAIEPIEIAGKYYNSLKHLP